MKHNTLTKIITLALAVVLALSLAACGSKTDDNSGDATAKSVFPTTPPTRPAPCCCCRRTASSS